MTCIKQILRKNNFPNHMINQFVTDESSNTANYIDTKSSKKYISAPYINDTSQRINRVLSKFNITLANRSTNTLKKYPFENLKMIENNKIAVEQYIE